MDPNGHIYMDDDENISAEDKARLDGYLRGRAEEGTKVMLAELQADIKAAAFDAKKREMEDGAR